MRENLDLSGGLIMSEAIMLELGRQIGRQQAHDAVYEAAQASFIEGSQAALFAETAIRREENRRSQRRL